MNKLTAPLTTVTTTALRTLVGATLLLCTANAQAFGLASLLNAPDPSWGFINNRQFVSGYVYTRGIYKNDQGYPVYVEYNAQGEEVAEIGPLDPNGPYGNTRIMAAREYQAYVEQYEADLQQFRDTYPNTDEPELLTLSAYQTRIGTLTTATEPADPWTGSDADTNLNPGTRSVLVRPQSLLYTPESPYLMRQYPIDMTGYQSMAGQTGSLLIDRNGQIVRTSQYRIALRAVYYENPNASSPEDRFESSSFVSGFIRSQGTVPTLTNPVQTLPLSTGLASLGAASTNEAGQYSMMITATPCPTFFYQYTEAISGQVPYRAFNPDISGHYQYPITRTFPFICNGMATYSFQPGTNPPITLDFPIDVNILTGAIRVPGVELAAPGTAPVYDLEAPDVFTQTQADYYDFDLDGTPDTTYCGVQDAAGLFVQEADCQIATVQGVYLSSAPNDPSGEGCNDDPAADLCQPNLLRVIDLEPVQEDKALVSQLAPEHLKDTDLFIIRQATGQLIAQRQGLKDDEAAYQPAGPDGLPDNNLTLIDGEVRVDYGMIMRGMHDRSYQNAFSAAMREEGGFSDWQAKGNMAPELYAHRTADQVRAGETLEVWAINRVTGYLGHAEIVVGEDQLSDGLLDTKVPDIELAAPNLKIWAERRYNIEAGLTKDEQRDYLISHEGAGEGDDTFIQIFVEWLDQDGSALPDALKDYGYTGRLAYVSGENTLSDASQAGQARFNIQPGKHSELLRLPSTSDNNLHYYVQVHGIPYNDYTDFALGDQNRSGDVSFEGTAENNYRPERFVPVKVPQYEEEVSTLQQQAYLTEKRRREEAGVSLDGLTKPIPLHGWYHRPEYQFSVYDLTVDSINLIGQDPDSPDEEILFDIKDSPDPKITGADIINILYSLQGSDEDQLPSLDGDQTLILALGQQETEITLTENNTLRFEDLSYINRLGSDDYLTIAVYTNADAGNLLWEYAFGLEPNVLPETAEISADDTDLDIALYFPSTNGNNRIQLQWSVDGQNGYFLHATTDETDGLHLNQLTVPPEAGAEYYVSARVIRSEEPLFEVGSEYRFGPYRVVPGVPTQLNLNSNTVQLPADETSTAGVHARVRDAHSNAVSDNTPITWSVSDEGRIDTGSGYTENGEAWVQVVAGDLDRPLIVTARVGDLEQTHVIEQTSFDITLTAQRNTAEPLGAPVTVIANIPDVADGAPIRWVSTYGLISGDSTVENGQARASFRPGPLYDKNARLYASVGQQYGTTSIDLQSYSPQPFMTVENPVLIGDKTEPGFLSLSLIDGRERTIPYHTSTPITVGGLTPGETYVIDLNGGSQGNVEPIAWYFMDRIKGAEAPDIYHDHPAQVTSEVVVDRVKARTGTGSYQFDGSGTLSVPHAEALDQSRNLGLGVSLYLEDVPDSPVDLVRKGDSYGLQLLPDTEGVRVRYWVRTDSGEQSLTSNNVLPLNQWHDVTAAFRAGFLRLQSGGGHQTTSLSEGVHSSPESIVVGAGYEGHLDGLKFFDYTLRPLAGFGNDKSEITLVADAQGRINTTIHSLGNLRTASPQDWFIEARVYWKREKDQVDVSARGSFIKFMTYGMAEGTANAMAQLFWDEGDDSAGTMVTDFASSILVVGDVRDLLKYGMAWHFGEADAAEKLTASIAGIGLLTTIYPPADIVTTSIKLVGKQAINTKAANVIADLGRRMLDDFVHFRTTTLDVYEGLFKHMAQSQQTRRMFERELLVNEVDAEHLATIQKLYGDEFDTLFNTVFSRLDNELGEEAANQAARRVSEALALAAERTGQRLTGNALEGLIKAARIMENGRFRGTLPNLVNRFSRSQAEELDEILKLINRLADYPRATGEIARLGARGDNIAFPVRFYLRDIVREGAEDVAFQVRKPVATASGRHIRNRDVDVLYDDHLETEYKRWSSGRFSWGGRPADMAAALEAGEIKRATTRVQWVSDMIRHADTNFVNLNWRIDARAIGQKDKLKALMLKEFDNELVRSNLRARGFSEEAILELRDDFEEEIFDQVVKFIEDLPVEMP